MKKSFVWLSVFGLALALLVGGCSVTTSTTNPATPPSGTTSITVASGGSATIESGTKNANVSLVLVDQSGTAITSTNYLTIGNITISIWATGVATASATVVSTTNNSGSSALPVSVAMSLDRSGSMSSDSNASLEAAANDFVNSMSSTDQAAILNFDSSVHQDQAMTSDKNLLHTAITNESSSGGATALRDSIGLGILTAEAGANSRKAVISMTDGGENASVIYSTTGEVITLAKAKGIPIYTIGLGSGVSTAYLQDIATETGGVYYAAPTAADLAALYAKISAALSSSWTTTMTSGFTFTAGNTYHIQVTVTYTGGITGSYTFDVTI